MSHICANDEYQIQVGVTNRPENIVIRYISVVSLSPICMESSRRFQFSFTNFSLVYGSAFAQIFPRSQPTRQSNTCICIRFLSKHIFISLLVELMKEFFLFVTLKSRCRCLSNSQEFGKLLQPILKARKISKIFVFWFEKLSGRNFISFQYISSS
jgi:hypothetical protein